MSREYVGGIAFATKAALRTYIQRIVARYADGERLSDDDASFMDSLLSRHSECALKRGAGVAFWYVRTTEYRNRCFWIERVDGTFTDVSWTHCVSPKSGFTEVCAAARSAVADEIMAFKCQALAEHPFCAITGDRLTMATAHVDHVVPFVELVKAFFDDNPTPSVSETTDGEVRTIFADPQITSSFADFHRKQAQLRIVTAAENLSRGRA